MTDWTQTGVNGLWIRNAGPQAAGGNVAVAAFLGRFGLFGSLSDNDDMSVTFGINEEVVVIGTGATTTGANAALLPADSLIMAVTGIVLVAIPTAATFTVGNTAQPARFASGVAVALGTKFVGTLHQNPIVASDALGWRNPTAGAIVIDPNLNPGAATGVVRIRVYYIAFKAPAV